MNTQLTSDARIDQIVTAIRAADPPAGMEARIAARLAQARTQACARPSFVAALLRSVSSRHLVPASSQTYATAALVLLATFTALTLLHHRPAADTAARNFNPNAIAVTQHHASQPSFLTHTSTTTTVVEGAAPHPRQQISGKPLALPPADTPASLSPSAQDPDQLALAETLAPSRPGPPLPLTTQEQTLVAATRPGQPIQLAELDQARAPLLRAEAEARRTSEVQRYVKTLLAPFAVADALQPTKFSEPREISQALPAPLPSSSTN